MDEEEYEDFKQQVQREVKRLRRANANQFVLSYVIIITIIIIATIVQIFVFPKVYGLINVVTGCCNLAISVLMFIQAIECTWSRKWAAVMYIVSIINMVSGVINLM